MTTTELLPARDVFDLYDKLKTHGLSFFFEADGKLTVHPATAVTVQVRTAIRGYRDNLVLLAKIEHASWSDDEWAEAPFDFHICPLCDSEDFHRLEDPGTVTPWRCSRCWPEEEAADG